MQRRAQEVIDACWALGAESPILLIHDVGAGGLSNAVPESVHQGTSGGRVDLRKVLSDEPGMSPLEIWCNEAQERYVLIVAADRMEQFGALCDRERCPYAVVGTVSEDHQLVLEAPDGTRPVDMPIDVLLGKPPRMLRDVKREAPPRDAFSAAGIDPAEAIQESTLPPSVPVATPDLEPAL